MARERAKDIESKRKCFEHLLMTLTDIWKQDVGGEELKISIGRLFYEMCIFNKLCGYDVNMNVTIMVFAEVEEEYDPNVLKATIINLVSCFYEKLSDEPMEAVFLGALSCLNNLAEKSGVSLGDCIEIFYYKYYN